VAIENSGKRHKIRENSKKGGGKAIKNTCTQISELI
jgi:hypothetical protein